MKHSFTTILLLISLAGCTLGKPPNQGAVKAIEQALAEPSGQPLTLAQVVPFSWDRFCVYGPYSDAASIEATTGFAWSGHEAFDLASSDSFYLLAFFQDQQPVSVETFGRPTADNSGIGVNTCYSPQDDLSIGPSDVGSGDTD